MRVNIHPSWEIALRPSFNAPYFKDLVDFVKLEYQQYSCYPPGNRIFEAFNNCPFDALKVVIIGQDPYHGPNQANGLCFSVQDGIPHPPSLMNIFKELETDMQKPYPLSGDLSTWASQGVFLLNATLTVRAHQAGSHQKRGWEIFTDQVIQTISNHKKGVVFLLWGGFAKQKAKLIDKEKHLILSSGHPSPLSANRGYWFGNKHFSQCNVYLRNRGQSAIDW